MRPLLGSILLLLAAAAWAWLDAEHGVETWRRLHREVAEAGQRIERIAARNDALRSEIEALGSDAFAQERAVREELRWARPGEVLVRTRRNDAPLTATGGGASLP